MLGFGFVEKQKDRLGLAVLILGGLFFVLSVSGRGASRVWAAEDDGTAQSESTQEDSGDSELSKEEKKKEIEKKKKELEEAEERADIYQSKTDKLGKKIETLEDLIGDLNEEIGITEQSIRKTQLEVDEIEKKIEEKEREIEVQEIELDQRREVLAEYMKLINRLSGNSMLEVMLASETIADYFKELNWLNQASRDLKEVYEEIKERKAVLVADKERLEEIKNEQVALRLMQEQQRRYLERKKSLKSEVLSETRGEESRYQTLLESEEELASKLTGELMALQSLGTPIDFSDALRSAQYVSRKTEVRVPFLLGILRVESNMGTNVGGGTYKKDMHPAQREIFKDICEKLGYDPKEMPVSKKPCYRDSDGNCSGWGGAMGPAQFMPSTWKGYEKEVGKMVNSKRPDPWNLRHALMAMGLKVAKVPGVTEGKRSAEKKAANIYLAGGNWDKFTWYGDRVLKFADAFEEKIEEEGL